MLNEGYHIKTYNTIEAFYDDIPEYLHNGVNNSPFQFKNWQKLLYDEFLNQKKRGRYIGAILFKHTLPVLGGHFFIKRTGRLRGLFLLGSGGDTDYNDLIWFTEIDDISTISKLIEHLLQNNHLDRFWISQVFNKSPLAKWAIKNAAKHIKSNPCAMIRINDSFDDYWKSLKKSTRQNIRTAQNRVKNDKKNYQIVTFEDTVIPEDIIKKYQLLYERRRITKNQSKKGIKYIITEKRRIYLKKKYNLSEEAMRSIKNVLSSYITIDNEIAGYFYGVKDYNGKVCLMHVAVNDKFSRYSPGMILLIKSIELIYMQKKIKEFDLTNGNESYKISLGAEVHSTEYYCFKLNREIET